MTLSRRTMIGAAFAAGSIALSGCAPAQLARTAASTKHTASNGLTQLYLLGTIHSTHRTSTAYSLGVLEKAIRRAAPSQILAELPPASIAEAYRSFRETGRVTERRSQAFPEYTDVVFPLTRSLDFEIIPTAGWTQEIASNRTAALRAIQRDSARSQQWAEHIAARRNYSRALMGRGDDPAFIHTQEYDALVEAAQTPYQRYFDADLGAGGWTQINAAHNALINSALDAISGQGLTAMITFGSWHKYMILRALEGRKDIVLRDSRALFG